MARFARTLACFARSTPPTPRPLRCVLPQAQLIGPLSSGRAFFFEVTQNRGTLVIDPNRSGKALLYFFVAELVQLIF
jgi:hypothetical protein